MARYQTVPFLASVLSGSRFVLLTVEKKESSFFGARVHRMSVVVDLDNGPAWGTMPEDPTVPHFATLIRAALEQYDSTDVAVLLSKVGWTVIATVHGRCLRSFVVTRNSGEINTAETVLLYEEIAAAPSR